MLRWMLRDEDEKKTSPEKDFVGYDSSRRESGGAKKGHISFVEIMRTGSSL